MSAMPDAFGVKLHLLENRFLRAAVVDPHFTEGTIASNAAPRPG